MILVDSKQEKYFNADSLKKANKKYTVQEQASLQ